VSHAANTHKTHCPGIAAEILDGLLCSRQL
jgi:hypothetical protein